MIIISGIISVAPSDYDAAVALFGPLVEATLAEPGNGTYGFWANPTEPGVFRVYEEWADEDALNSHMATPHMAEFLTGMMSLPITGTEINKHVVAETSKLM